MKYHYQSKPSRIEAIQWNGTESEEELVDGFFGGAPVDRVGDYIRFSLGSDDLELRAGKDGAQGWVPVPVGHWIVRQPGDLTDHWPVDPDYFAAKYEPVGRTA